MRDGAKGANVLWLAGALSALAVAFAAPAQAGPAPVGVQPPAFEENRGQAGDAAFVLRAQDAALLVARDGATVLTGRDAVRMRFVGGRADAARPEGAVVSRTHYLRGRDRSKWVTGVPSYASVLLTNVWTGVDARWHGAQGRVEYDFVVAPRADASVIRLRFDGADSVRIDDAGRLVVTSGGRELVHDAPVAWQDADSGRSPVDAAFALDPAGGVTFRLGAYDRARALTIDPATLWSRFLGGPGADRADAIAASGTGVLVAGTTTVPFGGTPPVGFTDLERQGDLDAFVAKLSDTGATVWTAILGGSNDDRAFGVAQDSLGRVVVAGETTSSTFPYTGPGVPFGFPATQEPIGPGGNVDGFVSILSPAGDALVWGARLGGTGEDSIAGVAVDGADRIHVTGKTSSSTDFPRVLAAQGIFGGGTADGFYDAFYARLPAAGGNPAVSTLYGGNGTDVGHAIAIAPDGAPVIAGYTRSFNLSARRNEYHPIPATNEYPEQTPPDGFLVRFEPTGTSVQWSRLIGGQGFDLAFAVAFAADGDIVAGGATDTAGLATPGVMKSQVVGGDGYVTRISPDGNTVRWFTYVGGSQVDQVRGIARLPDDFDFLLTGGTLSNDFPVSPDAYMSSSGGLSDAFVARISDDGVSLRHATYLGGSGADEGRAVVGVPEGGGVVAGVTASPGFPTTGNTGAGTYGGDVTDGFVAQLPLLGPKAPRNLMALLSVSGNPGAPVSFMIDLTWVDVDTAESGYRVIRTDVTNPQTATSVVLANLPPNATTFMDMSAARSKVYEYRVAAFDASGREASSASVTVRTPPNAPNAASMLTATPFGAGALLSWQDNSLDETGFRILRGTPTGAFRTVATLPANTSTFAEIPTSDVPMTFSWRVVAFNEGGDAPPSNDVTLLTTPTLDLTTIRGTLHDRASEEGDGRKDDRDEIRVRGRFSADHRIGFNPATDGMTFEVGPDSGFGPQVRFVVPAGDTGWRGRGAGHVVWRSARSTVPGPRARVDVDIVRGRFEIVIEKFTFAEPAGAQFFVGLSLGREGGGDRTTWTLVRPNVLHYQAR